MKNPLQHADVIFVPGGAYPEAAEHAAQLYHEGWAPYVLPSGKYSKVTGRFISPTSAAYETEWEYLAGILARQGVPAQAVLKEDCATYTWENAIFSKEALRAAGICVSCAILSCQAFHARRCLMYYQEQFPEVEFIVSPVETRGVTSQNWYLTQAGTDLVLGEVEKIGQQFHCVLPLGSENTYWEHMKGKGSEETDAGDC